MEVSFFAMFGSCPALDVANPKFEDAALALAAHPTWSLASVGDDVGNEDDKRRELFDRWVERRRTEAREVKRQRLLDHLEGCQWITVRTTWKEAFDKLERVPEFEELSKYDRVDIFDSFMAKVEARSVQSESVQDEIRKRKESQNRIKLRQILNEHLQRGFIHSKLTWKEYLASEGGKEASEAIRDVEANTAGSRPRDLFMDVIEEAEVDDECDE